MTNHRNRDPKTLEEWDNFLFRKYGHGLYAFCYALARIIYDSDPRYRAAPEYIAPLLKKGSAGESKQIWDIIKRRENLKKHIIEDYAKELKSWGWGLKNRNFDYFKYLKRRYPEIWPGLRQLFQELKENYKNRITEVSTKDPRAAMLQTIDGEIDFYKRILLAKSLWRKKGHPTETKNKVAFVFAQVIKKGSGETNWKVIKSLLVWLRKHIEQATYSSELSHPVYITTEILRGSYFKFIKNPARKSDIEHRAAQYFSPLTTKKGKRIKFEKGYITTDLIDFEDIESQYPTIVFPDGEILKGMFNFKEAAAFLNMPSSVLKRMRERGAVSYRKSEDEEGMTFSREELREWAKEIKKETSSPSDKKLVL